MMLPCKYCSGTGKLHDDADAFDDHEEKVVVISSSNPLATNHYVNIETYQEAMRRIEKLEKR